MKYVLTSHSSISDLSRPARGAWVEICRVISPCGALPSSRPARGAWVEIYRVQVIDPDAPESRPARGAWVEIKMARWLWRRCIVAPRKGRVG